MRSLLRVLALLVALGGLIAPAARADISDFGLESVSASLSTNEAGAHPDFFTAFAVKTDPSSEPNSFGLREPYGSTRNVAIALPPGLIGNLNAVPECTMAELGSWNFPDGGCPNASQVGTSRIYAYSQFQVYDEPVYLMRAPDDGETVARLGFVAGIFVTVVSVKVRSESDYGVTATVEDPNGQQKLVKAETMLWGVPGSSAHDEERQTSREAQEGAQSSPPRPPGIGEVPFMTNPTSCGLPMSVSFSVDSYQAPEVESTMSAPLPSITACGKVSFSPRLAVQPTNHAAASPTGLDAVLEVPQDETTLGRATSEVRNAVVTLPQGMTINAAAADGLAACSAAEAGYQRKGASHCPAAAKIGTAEFDVPALERPLHGAIYQRTPESGNLFRVWLVADEQGAHVKIPGEVKADPTTGQLTSIFVDNPQVPLRVLRLHFKEGPRAPLATPPACGTYTTHYELAPWSGRPPVVGDTPMTIGSGCATGGFAPRLAAGATSPIAGGYSTFVTTLTRADGEQNISRLDVELPRGVLAKLAGVEVCDEAGAAVGRCPAGARVGSVTVASGVGPSPLWVPQPDKPPTALYLAGPYAGAPYSLVVVVPAQAGPFDLGTVVTRAGIYIDPTTAQVTVRSDPLPQILEGVPITYRAISVAIDRPNFTLNPTSCREKAVSASLVGSAGALAQATSRFAVTGCRELGFGPRLSLGLKGGTRRTKHPALTAVLTFPKGRQANIAKAQVLLPASEQIDPIHVNNPCTRVQFNANACPKKSVLGRAKAFSPLLDKPLAGPVYFRSNGSERLLPDIVADLHGQIHIVLVGFIDTVQLSGDRARIRNTFASVPDAPVSKFVLELDGGKKGLLVNNTNLCTQRRYSSVKFVGQNGRSIEKNVAVKTGCGR